MKNNIWRKALSLLLALLMVAEIVPSAVFPASAAGVPEQMVTSLAQVYDGDEQRARADLESLYAAGLIDDEGNMIDLDIREDGKRASLSALAERIANGETVGEITVNGKAVTPEKLMQLQQVSSMLEVLRLIDADVEITDAHVASLQSLLEGIADGSIDLDSALRTGKLSMAKGALLMSAGDTLPATATNSGSVDTADGTYTAPYISGSTHEQNHAFTLSDPSNTQWYTESVVPDAGSEPVVAFDVTPGITFDALAAACVYHGASSLDNAKSFLYTMTIRYDSQGRSLFAFDNSTKLVTYIYEGDLNSTDLGSGYKSQYQQMRDVYKSMRPTFFTGTATLSAAPAVPVSFDWAVVSDTIDFTGATSGTVAWSANDKQLTKTFRIYPGAKPQNTYWVGAQSAVVNAGNIKNATFQDGKTAWSKTLQDSANDRNQVDAGYPAKVTTLTASQFTKGSHWPSPTYSQANLYYMKTKDIFSSHGKFTLTYETDRSKKDGYCYVFFVGPDVALGNPSSLADFKKDPFTDVTLQTGTFTINNSYVASHGLVQGKRSLTEVVKNDEVWLGLAFDPGVSPLTKVTISIPQFVTHNEVVGITAPAGTYYSGQVIPVTVTMKDYVIAPTGTTLTVNGVECPLLNADAESKTFTFGYTVKEEDSGAIVATAMSNTLKTLYDQAVTLDGAFPTTSIGADEGVYISSNTKLSELDWNNVKYGIDDAAPGKQTVTVVIPFKAGAKKTWIANETEAINPAISMSVPGYAAANAESYLTSAYFSTDGGATRYPVYVIGENADALAARFTPAMNNTSFLRRDTLCFYIDNLSGTTADYLGAWEAKKTDAGGFAFFAATSNDAAAVLDKAYSYYVKGVVRFDAEQTTARANYSEDNVMKSDEGSPLGFYKEGAEYVVVQGTDYSRQHDVELVVNEVLFKGAQNGIRTEDPNTLVLNYRISDRDSFTFTKPKDFTWSSSNEQIAKVVKDEETGSGQIVLTGGNGDVTITLTVGNGSESKQYDLSFTFAVLEGKSPFLTIPAFSKERTTLTETDTDVLFSSNITARNAMVEKETTFTAKLYKVNAVNDTPTGDPIWTESFLSTVDNTRSHITVPGDKLADPGIYAVVISARYEGGTTGGVVTLPANFKETAYLNVKQAPLKVTLNTLDSYSADYQALPTIGYTMKPANANAVVQYTIQKSGEAVSERKSASGGVIPFTAEKPSSLKDAYTITVYARSADAAADEPWSMDSMLLRVYNMDILDLVVKDVASGEIGGTTGGSGDSMNGRTVTMDNHGKLAGYGITGGSYQLTVSDLNALRTDMSLQKIISANYGSGVWGLLSDKMQWSSSNEDAVSINYEQGGMYSGLNNYSYTSYGPATDFLLVGKEKTDGVTITATHAGTGKTASVTVKAETLTDQLYIFQFNPKAETDVIYTNGAGIKRTLKSNADGVLAVYEPEGIKSAVMAMSKQDGQTYVGTIFPNKLQSGERDIASLQLYPTNNLRLRSISSTTLTFRNPDGSAYNGTVTLRVGVYKNDVYCPGAKVFLAGDSEGRGGREDVVAEVTGGKLTLGFDPTSFKHDPGNAEETGAYPGDRIAYVVEYRVEGYQTSYAVMNVYTDLEGEQKPTDSVIQLRTVRGGGNAPQITRQTIRQYTNGVALSYTRDVTDYTENVGVSKKYNKVELTTDFVLPSSLLTVDAQGYASISGEFALYTADGRKLTGQSERSTAQADQIIDLTTLKDSSLFVFPFSSSPIGRSVYTMTDENLKADGITDEGTDPTTSARVKATFVRDGMTLSSITLPFGVSNLSHQQDLTDANAGVTEVGSDIKTKLNSEMSIGSIFNSIDVNSMLKKGFAFLSGLTASGDVPISLMILPTEDPGVFRIVAFVGNGPIKDDDGDGLEVDYESKTMYEAYNTITGADSGSDDDDDDDDSGEVSFSANFSGTLVLEAGYDISAKQWKIDFRGGSVGMGFGVKYEWSQNFLCGPIPANISFEVEAHARLEVSFVSKSSAKLMLVDATIGVSIDAFAGLGFDASIATLKLGIYGNIGADVNFLLLSDFSNDTSTGTKLNIKGEIGIRLEVKILFIKYKTTFASTGFNWEKKWNNYDAIQRRWANDGATVLSGFTRSGRAYSMRLLSDGSALVAIEGGGEIENRDYLELGNRAWNSGKYTNRRLLKAAAPLTNALTDVQTNAYPYSNPVFVDDGSMFLYISDNDNAEKLQGVVSYAVTNGSGYDNMGPLYDTDGANAILADSDVVASGTGSNAFAAWVKQSESPDKEMSDKTTYDDLGMMMNATEIYAGVYNGSAWTTERLTTNNVADMAPTIASSGNRAIAAWRSLSATEMPEEGGKQDISAMFNAENNINYRIYNGSSWTDAKVAYNGSAGTVNAIDSAMLPDGTSILVYTVRTGEDVAATETFYTVIGADGSVITTGRLTNDSYTDTNAQVTAVGNQFVAGWYSEHDTSEKTADPETGAEQDVKAHDIRLARINANGSVDEAFPESIGGNAASGITADFKFSAPAGADALSKLAIVWSQKKDSEDETNDGKYELNAMRLFEAGDTIGVTAQTNIAETGANFTVDHFDTYTGEDGKVHVLVLGSDYNSLDGLAAYDTIDLSNQPVTTEDGSELLTILAKDPLAYMKLGAAEFQNTAIEVSADTDLRELVPGLDLPVQFTVKNTGASTVNKLSVQLGNESKTVENVSLLPNQSTILTMAYPVPEAAVKDVDYTVTADETATETGKLMLNRPDVGISSMKLLREESGERDIQVGLSNASGIPLVGSGKTVKLAFYRDEALSQQISEAITIPAASYADIDSGIFAYKRTVHVADLIGSAQEIPESGVRVYAKAWVEEATGEKVAEIYSGNNSSFIAFKGLMTKNGGQKVTSDTFVEVSEGGYKVFTDIRNNSLQPVTVGIPVAVLLDSEGNVIAQKNLLEEDLQLGTEARRDDLSAAFAADEVEGTPARAEVRSISTISFEVCDGSGEIASVKTDVNGHIVLPEDRPTPPESNPPVFFTGWYSQRVNGERITEEYTFTENTTVYAQYSTHQHVFTYEAAGDDSISVTCVNYADDCSLTDHKATVTLNAPQRASGYGNPNATVSGGSELLETPKIRYYTANEDGTRGEELTEAPTAAGKYWAELTLGEGNSSVTAHVTYEIPAVEFAETQYATIPDFVKITDANALDSMTACTGAQMLAWVYANENSLRPTSYQAPDKYIVFRKRFIQRPPDLPEEIEFPYDPDTEYADCYKIGMYGSNMELIAVNELVEQMANGRAEVYIMGDGSTRIPVERDYVQVSSLDNLPELPTPNTLDALAWIIANTAKYPNGIVILAEEEEDDYDKRYRYIQYGPQTAQVDAWYVFAIKDMMDMGVPVFIPKANDAVDPNLSYTVTFDANGGTGTTASQVYVKSTITVPGGNGLSKSDLTFSSWNTNADGSGTAYAPGDTLTVTKDVTLYAQWTHAHNWTYSYDAGSATYTAKCSVSGCPLGVQTLHAEPINKTYDGKNALPYTCSAGWTRGNGLAMPTITYYTDGVKVSEGKNVGTYTAKVRLKGIEAPVGEFSITPRPIVLIADDQEMQEGDSDPVYTVTYDGVGHRLRYDNDASYPWKIVTEGDSAYAKSGNGGKGDTSSTLTLKVTLEKAGTLSFDYKYGTENNWDWARFHVDGSEKFAVCGIGDWQTFTCDLSAGSHTLTWSYSKDGGTDKNGDFFAVDNVAIKTEGEVTQEEYVPPVDDTVPFEALAADLRFKNDGSYPWYEVTENDRTFIKSGNANADETSSKLVLNVTLANAGTLSFDYNYGSEGYCDWARFYVDDNQVFEKSGESEGWTSYTCDLSAGDHTLTWSYAKDGSTDENGDFFAVDNLVITSAGEVTQEDPNERLVKVLNYLEGGIVEGETLNYTASREQGNAIGTYTITVTPGENPNYDVRDTKTGTLTIVEAKGEPQTISAEDVTVTFGDTDKRVSGSLTDPVTGGGAISYAVKPGSEDYIAVDAATGALTIKKVPADGKAYVTVRAAKTEIYAPAAKDVTVTINPKAMTVSAPDVDAIVDGHGHAITVHVTDPAEGYTVKYGTAEGTYDLDESPKQTDAGTLTVYYKVTAENYLAYTGSATVAVSYHTHQWENYTASGDTITATCANGDGKHTGGLTSTLTIAAPEHAAYGDGKSAEATLTGSLTGASSSDIVYKQGDTELAAAPTDAGTYTASVTLGGVTASVTYTVAKADPTAVAPTAAATYGQTLSGVTLTNPDGNTDGTWTWVDEGTTSVGNAGSRTFKANFTPADTANYSTLSNVDVTVTVEKADATDAMKAASVRLAAKNGKTAAVDYALPDGASYGSVTNGNTEFFTVSTGSGLVLTAAKDWTETAWEKTAPKTFTVAVNGAANYNDYTLTVSVTPTYKPDQTIAADDVSATYGDTGVKLEAEVTTGDGALSYAVKSGDAVTVDENGELTIIKAGSATVTVTAAETENYAKAAKDVTVTVGKKTLTITADSASKAFDGTALTKNGYTHTALASGDSIESVTVNGTQTYVGDGSNVPSAAVIKRGETDVTGNYDVQYVNGTLTVTNRGTDAAPKYEITITANSDTVTYDGQAHTVSGFETTEFIFNNVKYKVSGLTATATATDADAYEVSVTGTPVVKDDHDHDVTAQFIVNTVNGALTINKRNVTLTSATDSKQYNGNALTNSSVTVTGDGWAEGEGATYNVTGSQTLVGTSNNAFTYTLNANTKAENYSITTATGTLTVISRDAKYEISPQANSGEFKYDGTEKTVTGFKTETFTVDSHTYTVSGLTAEAVGTDAGTYTVSVSGTAVVTDSNGNDVTNEFSVTPQAGTLTISKREVTLTSATDAKEYDGTALTSSNVTVSGDGWAEGEGATYNVTGSRTLVGTSDNAFSYTLSDSTKAENYTITTNNGTLTVNNRNAKYSVTLTANSGEFKYDGSEKNVSGWTIGGKAGGSFTAENGLTYTVSGMTATLTKTDAGTYDVTVTGTPVVKDSEGNDVTAQFAVSVEKGTLKIGKRSVTLTSATDSKAYDGTALTNDTVTVSGDGWAAGEGATYTVTGSQTLPENSANAFGYTLNDGTKAGNYEITKVEGTLTITNRNDTDPDKKYEITVTANSGAFTYDGTEKTVSGFETTEFIFNNVKYKVSGLTATAAATNAGTYSVVVTGTPVVKDDHNHDLTAQFIVNTVNGTLTVNKAAINGALVKLDAFQYDTAVPTAAFINDSNVTGANGKIVQGDGTKHVTYYYQSTAFLKSQTDNIEALAGTEGVFTELTPTTFEPGTHYVLAVVTGDNYNNVPYITQSVFEVTQNTETVRKAPAAPTVDGTKVTVDEADRAKQLEYSLDGKTWLPVALDEEGAFTAEWATPVKNAALLLRETADERYAKPSANATGTNAITTETFTVTYDANGGVNAPNAATVTADRTVTVSGKASMTRKGYTFTGWNTNADGNGTAYKQGDQLETGMTLYAQWTANTYKVRFSANGGTGTMEEQSFTYDDVQKLTKNAFERAEYTFLGWSKSANGSTVYQDEQSVKNLAESGSVTLYAVWAKELYSVKGSIKSEQIGEIKIELVQGNNAFSAQAIPYNTANAKTEFALEKVPNGIYDLVVTQGEVTKTTAVIIADGNAELAEATMPITNSVVEIVGEDTPAVVVGGLDAAAADEEIEDRTATVTLAIELQNEVEAGEAGAAILAQSRAKNAAFMDFTVTKTIFNNGIEEAVETITETKSPIELIIPFDFSGKSGVKLYRYHNGAVEELKQIKDEEPTDGTYKVDQKAGLIYVYASSFSTYAITYGSTYSSSSAGGSEELPIVIAATTNGKVTTSTTTPKAGEKVTVTITPDIGFAVDAVTATDAKGNTVPVTKNADGTYSFTQPDSAVTVKATFKAQSDDASCKKDSTCPLSAFTDLTPTQWYHDGIHYCLENSLMNGVGNGKFNPNGTTSRAMIVTILYRMEKTPAVTEANPFDDVEGGKWYTDAVIWAAANKIVDGYGNGKFGPDDNITREQLAAILFRYAKFKSIDVSVGQDTNILSFEDIGSWSSWSVEALQWAVGAQIMNGKNGKLVPKGDASRAEAATMIQRFCENTAK